MLYIELQEAHLDNTTTPATPNQREALAALAVRASDGMTEDELARALKKDDALVSGMRELLKKLAREEPPPAPAKEPPKPQIAHADICIERVIGGRKFRFRGFIRDDDAYGYVFGDTMLERVRASGDTPNEEEDNEHLFSHLDEWRNDTELTAYYVVTNERRPGFSHYIRCFDRGFRERRWSYLDSGFDRLVLVACRAA